MTTSAIELIKDCKEQNEVWTVSRKSVAKLIAALECAMEVISDIKDKKTYRAAKEKNYKGQNPATVCLHAWVKINQICSQEE